MNNAAPEYVMVYVTTGTRAEAEAIAEALVRDRLVACVNVLGEATSVYRWQGAIEESSEVVLVAKTRRPLFEKLAAEVKRLHSYDVPCIVAYPMADADAAYMAWIKSEASGP